MSDPDAVRLPAVLRLTIRTARAHWRRFVLTTAAIVVGVSFVVGSFVLTDSLAASIDRLLGDAVGKTDLVVRAGGGRGGVRGLTGQLGGGGGGGGGGGTRTPVPAGLVATVAALAGVQAADGSVTGTAQLLDKQGNAARFDIAFVSNWPAHPEMSAVRLISGRPPAGPDDVVIDTATAAARGLELGNTVRIATKRGVVTETVVGLGQRGAGNLGSAGYILAFTQDRATELVGTAGNVDSISVQLAPGVTLDQVRSEIVTAAGPGISVLDADTLLADARQRIQDRLTNFTQLMLGFAAVTLFVSSFLIWNTFSIVVAQRTRELALLRAVGASAAQVARSVVGEGAVVGVAASGVGLGAGIAVAIGLRRLLGVVGIDLPSNALVVAPRTVVLAAVVGLGITMISVIGPARRSTSIPPIAALQAAAVPPARGGGVGPAIGVISMLAGLAAGAKGLADTTALITNRMTWLGVGAALLFTGIALTSRRLVEPVIGVLGLPFRLVPRFGGVAAALAIRNAVRDPRRTASTALALMIGIALVAMSLVLGESVKTAFGGALRDSIRAEVVVDAGGIAPFDAQTLADIAAVPGVATAVPLFSARVGLAGAGAAGAPGSTPPSSTQPGVTQPGDPGGGDRPGGGGRGRLGVSTGDLDAIARMTDPAFQSGGFPTDDTHIAISRGEADDRVLQLGSQITLRAGAVDRVLTVGGIYQRDELLDDAVVRPGAVEGLEGIDVVSSFVLVQPSGTPGSVLDGLAQAASIVPNSSARTTDDYVDAATGTLDLVLGIVDVLLLFAVLVAGLGIANTLALSVVERLRELGLLRVVGMERNRMRRMVRIEGVLVSLFGGVLGIALGVGFGAAVAAALPVDTAVLSVPLLRLGLLFVAAALLGLIAAAVPARRAARLQMLEAIAD